MGRPRVQRKLIWGAECPLRWLVQRGWGGSREGGVWGVENKAAGTSLVVQWLRLHAPNAGGLGSIPSWGTSSHILQLRVCKLQLKILLAATEIHAAKQTKRSIFSNFIYLFGHAESSVQHGLFSSCGKRGLLSSWGARASHCDGFSSCGTQALGCSGFSRCGTWAQ